MWNALSAAEWSPTLVQTLSTALTRYYCVPTEITGAEPLAAGLTNRCLRLTDSQGGRSVWRPHGRAANAFAIDRSREAQAQSLAAEHGLARQPIVHNGEGLLVPWVDGEPLCDLKTDHASILIPLLARIHELPTDLETASVEAQCAHYEKQLPDDVVSRLHRLKHKVLAHNPSSMHESSVVCHMDLGAYNVVIGLDGNPCVLDWEYARAGDPYLDIALFCRANGWSPDPVVAQYCALRSVKTVSRTLARVNAWLPFTDYLALCWYEVGASLYALPAYKEAAEALYKQLLTDG